MTEFVISFCSLCMLYIIGLYAKTWYQNKKHRFKIIKIESTEHKDYLIRCTTIQNGFNKIKLYKDTYYFSTKRWSAFIDISEDAEEMTPRIADAINAALTRQSIAKYGKVVFDSHITPTVHKKVGNVIYLNTHKED